MKIIARRLTITHPSPKLSHAKGSAKAPVHGAVQPGQIMGLGDLVERAARPVAAFIDRVSAEISPRIATRVSGCSACSKRRHFLNVLVSQIRSLKSWLGLATKWGSAWRAIYGCKRASKKGSKVTL